MNYITIIGDSKNFSKRCKEVETPQASIGVRNGYRHLLHNWIGIWKSVVSFSNRVHRPKINLVHFSFTEHLWWNEILKSQPEYFFLLSGGCGGNHPPFGTGVAKIW